MSWQDNRRRRALMDQTLADPLTASTGQIPAGYRAAIDAHFGDMDGLLLALYSRWFHAFGARFDAELEASPTNVAAAARRAWNSLADDQPVLHAVLRHYLHRPRLADASRLSRTPEADPIALVSGTPCPGQSSADVPGSPARCVITRVLLHCGGRPSSPDRLRGLLRPSSR